MKGLVVLATVLLVPAIGYLHTQYFEGVMGPGLEAGVLGVLRDEGVEEPEARMDYLDAVISGQVDSEEARVRVAGRVGALPGVRMLPRGNRLEAYGWLRISRRQGELTAEGVVPPGFTIRHPGDWGVAEGWAEGVRHRPGVRVPHGAAGWGGLLEAYFGAPGDRSIELRRRGLVMRGDATIGQRADWLAQASEVVDKATVSGSFELYPSVYHLPGYRVESMVKGKALGRMQEVLSEAVVVFDAGSAEVPASEAGKISRVAEAMLSAGAGVRFLVGGHPGGGGAGGERLARERAAAVLGMLHEYGVDEERLEKVTFGAVESGEWDHRVEFLVK